MKFQTHRNDKRSCTNSLHIAPSTPNKSSRKCNGRHTNETTTIETCNVSHITQDILVPPLTKLKVRTEGSALVLASIVVLFLVTHSFRLALKVYEVASPDTHTIQQFKICFALKR